MVSENQLSYRDKIITVLNDSETFGFNEIRLNSKYQEIFKNEIKLKQTVELFCFGTFNDYLTHQNEFIELDEAALYKLKQLTFVSESLASNSFTFEYLNNKIGNLSFQEFEKLIVSSIYSKIVKAKLYSEDKIIEIDSSIGRDVLFNNEVKPSFIDGKVKSIGDLLEGLEEFNGKIGTALNYLLEIRSQVESKPRNDMKLDHKCLIPDKEEETEQVGTSADQDQKEATEVGNSKEQDQAQETEIEDGKEKEQELQEHESASEENNTGQIHGSSAETNTRKRKITK